MAAVGKFFKNVGTGIWNGLKKAGKAIAKTAVAVGKGVANMFVGNSKKPQVEQQQQQLQQYERYNEY
jgi:hypothetical protein